MSDERPTFDRPILFSDPMVVEIKADRKTQTRRLILPQPNNPHVFGVSPIWGHGVPREHVDPQRRFGIHAAFNVKGKRVDRWLPCRYGGPGDRLWVREAWAAAHYSESPESHEPYWFAWDVEQHGPLAKDAPGLSLHYRADGEDALPAEFSMPHGSEIPWRPSIHMPRWVSRLTLGVVKIRAERLQEITDDDIRAEGVTIELAAKRIGCPDPDAIADLREAWQLCWDSINGRRASWASNPWVWAVEFRRIEQQAKASVANG